MGLVHLILKAFKFKKEKRQRKLTGTPPVGTPVNEAEGELLQCNFDIPSGPSGVCIPSAHTNKTIGLHEKLTVHYWSTWKQLKIWSRVKCLQRFVKQP